MTGKVSDLERRGSRGPLTSGLAAEKCTGDHFPTEKRWQPPDLGNLAGCPDLVAVTYFFRSFSETLCPHGPPDLRSAAHVLGFAAAPRARDHSRQFDRGLGRVDRRHDRRRGGRVCAALARGHRLRDQGGGAGGDRPDDAHLGPDAAGGLQHRARPAVRRTRLDLLGLGDHDGAGRRAAGRNPRGRCSDARRRRTPDAGGPRMEPCARRGCRRPDRGGHRPPQR